MAHGPSLATVATHRVVAFSSQIILVLDHFNLGASSAINAENETPV